MYKEMNLDNKIINKRNKEYVKKLINSVVDSGIEFKFSGDTLPTKSPAEKWIGLDIGTDGIDCEELIYQFNNYIMPACSNFGNEGFMGFPDAGNSISGMLGAVYSDLLQQNLINESFCAPVATKMEMELITTLRKLAGYNIKEKIQKISDVGGIITYGGTGSNATAMMLARENRRLNTLEKGITCPEKFKVIIPKGIGHYSIRSSLKWLGCGNQVIEVDTDGYKYNLDELQKTLTENKGEVMAVVAYAGDSRTMAIEYLDKVYEIVHGIDPTIWCHVDACHGFSLLFSEKHKSKLKGIENFDSISCDPHKVLALPYCCSALLLKDGDNFDLILSNSDLIMDESYAFGQITPFIGSKSWVSLKLWFVMKNFGTKGIGELIDRRIELAQYFANKVAEDKELVLLNDVEFNSVVFVYTGKCKTANEINNVNTKIYQEIKKEGKFYLHQFPIADNKKVLDGGTYRVLRYMSGNYNLMESKIDQCIDYIKKLGNKIANEEIQQR